MIAFCLVSAVWLAAILGLLACAAWLATRSGWWPVLTAVVLFLIAVALLAGYGVYLDDLGQVPRARA